MLAGGVSALAIGAIVLTLLNIFIKPVIRIITAPLRWLTLGLFNIIINIAILWLADQILPSITIHDYITLFLTSLIVSFANIFF